MVVGRLKQAWVVKPTSAFLVRELLLRREAVARYRVRSTGHTVHVRHRTDDPGNLTEVFVQSSYQFPERVLDALSDVQDIRAADLGGFIGLFGVKLLERWPNATIVAVEPDPGNAEMLRQTVIRNGMSARWTVVQACASTQVELVRFSSGQGMGSHVSDEGAPVLGVDVFPLIDDAHLVKIDIEGAEWAILTDPRFRELPARVLFLEYHPPHQRADVVRVLEQAGWSVLPFEERVAGFGELWAVRDVASNAVAGASLGETQPQAATR